MNDPNPEALVAATAEEIVGAIAEEAQRSRIWFRRASITIRLMSAWHGVRRACSAGAPQTAQGWTVLDGTGGSLQNGESETARSWRRQLLNARNLSNETCSDSGAQVRASS